MPINNLLSKLNAYLDKGERKKKAHCERVDYLLGKLKKKQKELEAKLATEKDSDKRKRLKTELKVIKAQRKKGQMRREELEVKCQ